MGTTDQYLDIACGGSDRQIQLATHLLGGVVWGGVWLVEGQTVGRSSYIDIIAS